MPKSTQTRTLLPLLVLAAATFVVAPAQATEPGAAEIEELREALQELRERDAENRRKLEAVERQLEALQQAPAAVAPTAPAAAAGTATADAALDAALEEADAEAPGAASSDIWSAKVRGAEVRLIDISFDLLTAAGTSTERTESIQNLQAGAHDPLRRGFTLQQGEFSLSGAVDPYLTAEAHIIFFPEGVEFEEGFFQTSSLPWGLQVEGGYFFTEFGLINPTHPHSWEFIDQPVINGRLFGGDGTRSVGGRVGWLTPLPWFSEMHFGLQNATGDAYTPSFIGSSVGGRPTVDRDVHSLEDLLYLTRWYNSVDLNEEVSAGFGVSGLFGPNNSGPDGKTFIYGADLKVRWRPVDNFRGFPFVTWQTELIKRDYTADWFIAGSDTASSSTGGGVCHGGHCHGEEPTEDEGEVEFPNDLPGTILRDTGLYTQLVYGFRPRWAAGVRYEFASGSGQSVVDGELVSRQMDPSRDDRHRVSPLLIWQPTEFSRFRLQYNFDHAGHLDDDAHTVWIGAEVLYGAHPAHGF
jgi:hypothetical protein